MSECLRSIETGLTRSNKLRTLALHHAVCNLPETGNFYVDQISVLQPLWRLHESYDAAGSARHYDRSGSQSPSTTEVADDGGQIENQVFRASLLPQLPAHLRGQ